MHRHPERSRRALCPESRLPAKKRRESFIFSPPLHAHTRYVSRHLHIKISFVIPSEVEGLSLPKGAQLSRLWWLFDCRNPATALLIRKKSSLPLKKGHHFFFSCGAWGCLIAAFQITFPKKGKQEHPSQKKINKKKVKVCYGFK